MWHKMRFWVAMPAVLGLCVANLPARAQDYPTHKGNNQRQGRNGDPYNNSPGVTNLRWWHPNIADGLGLSYYRDNTSKLTTATAGWIAPDPTKEASYPYIPSQTGNAVEDANISSFFDPASPNYLQLPIVPAYVFTATTPSAFQADPSLYDPTVPATGTAQTFTWDVTPSDPTPKAYGIYVWLPAGPTDTSTNATPNLLYPQRYFVYSVQYGGGQRFVDVVDTAVAGTGWVRLGAGGAPTTKAFQYTGTGTMTVTLYNTIPRDSSGNLLITPDQPVTLVYADGALAAPSYGSYSASPIINQLTGGTVTNTVAAMNVYEIGLIGSTYSTTTKGVVTSYNSGDGSVRWSFSPLEESDLTVNLDSPSAQVAVNPPWAASTTATGFQGVDYDQAALAATAGAAGDVVYTPKLADGDYDVFVWLAGSNNGVLFPHQTEYDIHEGATVTTVYVDQDGQKGWVRLGTRRWKCSSTAPLVIHVLNFSNDPTDQPAGRVAYSDAMRFVGAANLAIESTPVQVNGALLKLDTSNNPPVATDVTIVAAENGRIYCLDSNGNADGTTNVYWTYPSTPDPSNASWTDPNQVSGLDGAGGIAEMPTSGGFNLSSAVVQRINGVDYLYIAAQNGRVYCIDMTGRGDMNLATRKPGTTTRVWSYPDDYPATPKSSALGAFTGSLVFATNAAGPTIYVPAPQGRIYALDAVGNGAQRTTKVRWQYPAATSPTLGQISMTPAIEFNNIYFGTQVASDSGTGEFYALNIDTGAVVWKFTGTALLPADDFISSPATVPAALFTNGAFPQVDTVFAANENNTIYALDAKGNGDGTTNVLWSTNELGTGVKGALSFVPIQAYDTTGNITAAATPALLVPTTDGRIDALAADGSTNVNGGKRLFEYVAGSGFTASLANGRGWLVGGTDDGYLYAFNAGSGNISPGNPPGNQTITENNPAGADYRNATVKFIDKATYTTLRTAGNGAAEPTYAFVDNATAVTGNPLAFEWGQTMYAVIYKFPHAVTNPGGGTVPPPTANFALSTPGGVVRNVAADSKQLTGAPTVNGTTLDGYAVLSYAIQSGGQTSLAPGRGAMTVSITTGALNNNGARQGVALNPALATLTFYVANPLSLLMDGTGDLARAVGYTVNPADPENLVNGSRNVGSPTKFPSQLVSSVGLIAHGQSGSSTIGVVDRSLMTLLLGPGRGLSNVRYERRDLGWNGGPGAVYKPLDPILYPGYEDLPVNYPNTSLDYPNIGRETITVVKDIFGNAENPLFSSVSLNPPTFVDPTNPDPTTRTMNVTPFDIKVDVPLFQPPNQTPVNDSTNTPVAAGYIGRDFVFVDSNGTGSFVRNGGRRDAYRSFSLASNVDVDERVTVTTPTVDLGSLTEGALFSPAYPWDTVNSPVNPVSNPGNPALSPFAYLFQPFTVTNPGNVNLRALRVAKLTKYEPNPVTPWPIFSPANHELVWLEPSINVFSSLDNDPRWRVVDDGGNPHPYVVLQKARPGDRIPTELNVNSPRRANANLGVMPGLLSSNPLIANYQPSIAASIPIGMPVGTYAQIMRVINEDDPPYPADQALSLDQYGGGLETYSDPTFILRFNVREARMTNTFTRGGAPMMDNLVAGGERFLHSNMQPTVMRTTDTGSLVVAWASTRAAYNEPEPGNDAKIDPTWRIYLGSLMGNTPAAIGGVNPLRELNFFTPASNTTWFQQSASAPFPACTTVAQANDLFKVNGVAGDAAILGTVSFGSPSFPVGGFTPNTGSLGGTYMAFVGEAQIQSQSGRTTVSRIFFAPVTVDASGVATVGQWVRNNADDTSIRKGRPSVVEAANGCATFYFSGNAAGQSQIYYTSYDPRLAAATIHDKWTTLSAISAGTGFESVSSPSVSTRVYRGVDYAPSGLTSGQTMAEMTFVGKLRGRPNQEAFLGRFAVDPTTLFPVSQTNGAPTFSYLPMRNREVATADGGNVFRTEGVAWNLSAGFKLEQVLNGVITDLEVTNAGVPSTRTIDETTGLMTFDSKLGGKVYVDPNIGTIRFAGATPSNQAMLMVTYQPLFLRVSGPAQEAAYTAPTGLFDNRMIGDASYWARQGTAIGIVNTDTDPIGTARYVFTYERAAAGNGQAARPFVRTMRLGVQLPSAVSTQPNGVVTALSVTGNVGPYQIDPVAGRVYFTDIDENRAVTVNYVGVDEAGQVLQPQAVDGLVTLISERNETPIQIEQAVNEAGLTSLLDPFDPGGQIGARRPGLIWLFWSSTRAGAPDLYFETIAPRWTPIPTGR